MYKRRVCIDFQDKQKFDEERILWAKIHKHDERIERNEENIRQYEMEKSVQPRNVLKRKSSVKQSPKKKLKVSNIVKSVELNFFKRVEMKVMSSC